MAKPPEQRQLWEVYDGENSFFCGGRYMSGPGNINAAGTGLLHTATDWPPAATLRAPAAPWLWPHELDSVVRASRLDTHTPAASPVCLPGCDPACLYGCSPAALQPCSPLRA